MSGSRNHLIRCLGCFGFSGVHKLEKGSVTLGMVTNIQPQVGLLVKLPFGNTGTVAVTDMADAYKPNPLDGYSKDQLIRSVNATLTIRRSSWLEFEDDQQ